MIKQTLGQLLKQQRAVVKLTQRELGSRLGVKASHIAYLEAGRHRPSLALSSRLADVLGLKKELLFLLAHPEARGAQRAAARPSSDRKQAWRSFVGNKRLLARHAVKPRELQVLSRINLLGRSGCTASFPVYSQFNPTSGRRRINQSPISKVPNIKRAL
jgi:transcriptional regulator with XRE-family HTH domain